MRKYLYAVVLGLVMNVTAASAANVYDVSYDMDTEIVSISGYTSAKQKVTLEILKAGINSEDLNDATVENMTDYIYRVDQTLSDADGKFKFSFMMPSSQDEYVTRVNVGGVYQGILVCVNPQDYIDALDAVNGASTDVDMHSAIIEKGKFLGMTNPYFSLLSDDQQLKVANDVLNARNSLQNQGQVFGDSKEILPVFNESTAVSAFNASNTNPQINAVALLQDSEVIFKLKELKEYPIYEGLDADQQKTVVAAIANSQGVSDVNSIRTKFAEKVALAGIDYMNGYDKLYDMLSAHNDIYQIDFSAYSLLSDFNRARVMLMIAGNTYDTPLAVKQAFDAAVGAALLPGNVIGGGSSGSGGSSGGGSGSSGGAVTISPGALGQNPSDSAIKPFSDLGNYAWAEQSILTLYKKNIVSGKGDGKFYPGDYVKREEFVKMLISAIGAEGESKSGLFSDVDESAWYASYVNRAVELELVSGVTDNAFGTGYNISRQDLATMLYRAAKKKGITLPIVRNMKFSDTDEISGYAKEAVMSLANAGIISGIDGDFAPAKRATRAEAAKMICEFLKYYI